MDYQHALRKLRTMKTSLQELNTAFEVLYDAVGSDPDSRLNTAVVRIVDLMLSTLAENIEVSSESLSWLVLENAWGDKQLSDSIDGIDFVIDSLESFLEFEKHKGVLC